MKRLLSIELQKIWLNKSSRTLSIAYFCLLSLIALIASIKFDLGFIHIDPAEMGIFNFPFIWHFNTYIASVLKFFLAIVIVSMMANEYSYGTLKQNLIDGLSKKEFVLTKFLTVVLYAFAATIFVFIMTLFLGYSFSSYTEIDIVFSELEFLVAFFFKMIAFFTLCLFVGILVKRSAFALGFLMVWGILESIIKGVLSFKIFPTGTTAATISQFLPLESMSNLIVAPWPRLTLIKTAGAQLGVNTDADYHVHLLSILIVLGWTIIFLLGSYKLLENRDL